MTKRIECPLTKESLEDLYVRQGLSLSQIASQLNVSNPKMVWTWLKRYEIPIRAFSTKGVPSTKRGVPLSEETKEKLRQTMTGRKQPFEQRLKHSKFMLENNPFLGKTHSAETRKKMSEAERVFSLEGMRGVHKRMDGNSLRLGAKHTDAAKEKLSIAKRGEKHPNWQGGITPISKQARKSWEVTLAKKAALLRDEYRCVLCGSTKRLEVDHIKSFARHPELRAAIDNLRTLCSVCHRKTDNYGGHSKKKLPI